jgi:hypothetical protein
MHLRAGFDWLKIAAVMMAITPVAIAAQTRPSSPSQVDFPFSDARKIGPNSVRFSAAQLTKAPAVVLFGATTETWHKARAAIQQAIFEGVSVSGVFMGPTTEAPSMEVYAQGHHVSNPIDLRQISQAEITRLLRDVWREYYGQKN